MIALFILISYYH